MNRCVRSALLWAATLGGLMLGTPRVAQAAHCPNLAVLLDKSGSMHYLPNGMYPLNETEERWYIAKQAVKGLLDRYDKQLPIGLSMFPADAMCGVDPFQVPVGLGTKDAILAKINAVPRDFDGLTPTGPAIDSAAATVELKDSARGQFVLLITDGEPRCTTGVGMAGDPESVKRAQEAVDSIAKAAQQKPPIKTFVVGFGALSAFQRDTLNRLATAGGVPDKTDAMYQYYRAEDAASLQVSLDKILRTVITSGDATSMPVLCVETCYTTPCTGGQLCVQSQCVKNPCDGLVCGTDQYCFTDGKTASCKPTCKEDCAVGQRCIQGVCKAVDCLDACSPGKVCNPLTHSCEPDAKCKDVLCKANQGCVAGSCVDDPCALLLCPSGGQCVPMEGTCITPPPPTVDPGAAVQSGCSCEVGRAGPGPLPLGAMTALLCGVLLRRRRNLLQR